MRPHPPSPAKLFPALFARLAAVRPDADFKAFADAAPRASPDVVNHAFAQEAPGDDDAFLAFLARWFEPPAPAEDLGADAAGRTLGEHIARLWPRLIRPAANAAQTAGSSLIALPRRSLIPGGMFRESYYWDSYFTMLGLGREDHAIGPDLLANGAAQLEEYGRIPNGARTYYLSRSQPPVFYLMVALCARADGGTSWEAFLPALRREHAFWMAGAEIAPPGGAAARVLDLGDGAKLNRYWDDCDAPRDEAFAQDLATAAGADRPAGAVFRDIRAGAESGWDFSSRWFADAACRDAIATTSIAPVDLNALLFGLERAIAAASRRSGRESDADLFTDFARARRRTMTRHCWRHRVGAFCDYDWRAGTAREEITAAALYPLFTGMASADQAAQTAARVEADLLAPGGLLTTTRVTGEQWDAPNGWAPLHWIAVAGLRAYGHERLAREIATRWLATVAQIFAQTGRLLEKYDVAAIRPGGGGDYPLQDGFGWTNGVTRALLDLYPELRHLEDVSAPPRT